MLEVLKLFKELQKDVRANKRRNPSTALPDNDKKKSNKTKLSKNKRRTNISKYCWTHGAWHHHSKDCNFLKEGHQNTATFDNKMGGSTLYCVEAN